MRPTLAAVLFAAACNGVGTENAEVTAEQIEQLSTPQNVVEDPAAAIRLEPLGNVDLSGQGLESGCRFVRDGRLLVAASDSNAIARIAGARRHFVVSSPLDATGGFFEDRQISVSIGLRDPAEGGARLAVTNRRTQFQQEWVGDWACGQ